MEMIPGRFIARMFYTELDPPMGPGNLLGWVYRDKGQEAWAIEYRFRYYEDDDLTRKSKDRKSGYEGRAFSSLPEVLNAFRRVFEVSGSGKYEEIIIDSDDPEVIIKRVREQPWAHVSEEKERP
jgi:hypothetical protein